MKSYRYLIMAILAVSCFTSCLDEDPLYSQNNSVIFSSESNAKLALLGCYSYMASTSAYGQHMQEIPISGSGFAFSQRNGSDRIVSLQALPSDGLISTTWNGMYKVISEVNAYLANLNAGTISEDLKRQFGGEAKFLRALAYYNLVTLFGDVPLKVVASTSEGVVCPRSPREEVLAQIVIDLKDALNIAEKIESGRVSSWAVKAFLGKVYYKMAVLGINATENWKNAKNMFDEVYNSKKFALEINYADLFGEWVTNSSESIFQINFSLASSSCFNRASNRFSPTASTTGVNWSTYRASKAAYDMHYAAYPGDPRIAATFLTVHRKRKSNNQPNPAPQVGDYLSANDSVYYYPYFTYKVMRADGKPEMITKEGKEIEPKLYVGCLPYDKFENPANPSLKYMKDLKVPDSASPQEKARIEALNKIDKEFCSGGKQNSWPAHMKMYDPVQKGTASHKNLIIYRYAEMLLLMADVYNELGETKKAIDLVEEVLSRARHSKGGLGGEPKAWSTNLTQDQVREKIFFERLFELNGEPVSYEMARIRGIELFKKALLYHNNHELTQASDRYYQESSQRWADRLYNDGKLTDDYLKMNLLLPIPESEMDANPGIVDNNFGY